MKKRVSLFVMMFALIIATVSAVEVNYSSNSAMDSSGSLDVTQLKYEPYPVNPGEYFDLWLKAQWKGSTSTKNVTFKLVPTYPFYLDNNENAVKSFGKITPTSSEPFVVKYKVRVHDDAVEGINNLRLNYNQDGDEDSWVVKDLEIQIADAQTVFDLVIQESTDTGTSIAIANTGKNTANSLIVRIPEQENFIVIGTNGQIVGNLASGDYSLVTFNLKSQGRTSEQVLKIQLDYTDSIGERRTVTKEIAMEGGTTFTMNATQLVGQRGRGILQKPSTGVFQSTWFWIIVVVAVILAIILYRKFPKVRGFFTKSSAKNKSEKNSKEAPDWVANERASKKK